MELSGSEYRAESWTCIERIEAGTQVAAKATSMSADRWQLVSFSVDGVYVHAVFWRCSPSPSGEPK